LLLFTADNSEDQREFCCYLMSLGPGSEGFRGVHQVHGSFRAAFNSDISDDGSIRHTG
jgi:hypothetical protein